MHIFAELNTMNENGDIDETIFIDERGRLIINKSLYDENNRLVSQGTVGQPSNEITYDDQGRLLMIKGNGTLRKFTYKEDGSRIESFRVNKSFDIVGRLFYQKDWYDPDGNKIASYSMSKIPFRDKDAPNHCRYKISKDYEDIYTKKSISHYSSYDHKIQSGTKRKRLDTYTFRTPPRSLKIESGTRRNVESIESTSIVYDQENKPCIDKTTSYIRRRKHIFGDEEFYVEIMERDGEYYTVKVEYKKILTNNAFKVITFRAFNEPKETSYDEDIHRLLAVVNLQRDDLLDIINRSFVRSFTKIYYSYEKSLYLVIKSEGLGDGEYNCRIYAVDDQNINNIPELIEDYTTSNLILEINTMFNEILDTEVCVIDGQHIVYNSLDKNLVYEEYNPRPSKHFINKYSVSIKYTDELTENLSTRYSLTTSSIYEETIYKDKIVKINNINMDNDKCTQFAKIFKEELMYTPGGKYFDELRELKHTVTTSVSKYRSEINADID